MKHSPSNLKQAVITNPITIMGLVCLMLGCVFVQSEPVVIRPELFFGLALAVALWARHLVPWEKQHLLFFISFFLCSGVYSVVLQTPYPTVSLLLIGLGLLAALFIYWIVTKQLTFQKCVLLCMAAGFLLRLCYVLYTPVWERQHDVFYFSYGEFTDFTYQRHAEYIEYIATYLKLPQENPTLVGLSQLYHPPLHHFIAGLWLRLQWIAGIDRGVSYENIQLLTLFYSSACMVIGYRLLKLLGCKRWGLLLPMAVLCFHPTFIIMAGSINNDLLSITLALYGVYAAVRWYRRPTFYHIITVALGIGFSMMTKLSGGLIAPGIALLFLWKWISASRKQGSVAWVYVGQFAVFGAICFPLALWWPVKNAILYDMPLTFVPALGVNSGQYLGDYTIAQRLFGLPKESFSNIFMAWNNQGQSTYNEYNLLLSLVKTSVFGEFTLFPQETTLVFVSRLGHMMSQSLFWSNLGVILLSAYASVRAIIRSYKQAIPWVLLLVWGVILYSYVQFCFAFPQACTQNFRYAVPTLVCGILGLGVYLNQSGKVFRWFAAGLILLFCFSATMVYWLLGIL